MTTSEEMMAQVGSALDASLSHDSSVRKPAEQWLTDAEESSATQLIQVLIHALRRGGFGPQTRHLASLLLKNIVKRRWRKTVDPVEKPSMREACVGLCAEEQDAAHSGLALAGTVAAIAAEDFPQSWPTMVTVLMAATAHSQSQGGLEGGMLRCILTAVQFVFQDLAARPAERALDMKSLSEIAGSVVGPVCHLWAAIAGDVLPRSQGQNVPCRLPVVELIAITSRILCSLSSLRIPFPQAHEIMPHCHSAMKGAAALYCQVDPHTDRRLLTMLERCTRDIGKLWVTIQRHHPLVAIQDLRGYLDYSLRCLGEARNPPLNRGTAAHGAGGTPECLLAPCLYFLAGVLSCLSYTHIPDTVVTPQKELAVATMQAVFTVQTVSDLARFILSNFLALQPEQVEDYLSDPEEAIFDLGAGEEGKDYRCSQAAEEVMVALFMSHKEAILSNISQSFSQASNLAATGQDPTAEGLAARDAALQKDAAIQALRLGVRGFEMDLVDGAALYQQGLQQEFQRPPVGAQAVVQHRILRFLAAVFPYTTQKEVISSALIEPASSPCPLVRTAAAVGICEAVDHMVEDKENFNEAIEARLVPALLGVLTSHPEDSTQLKDLALGALVALIRFWRRHCGFGLMEAIPRGRHWQGADPLVVAMPLLFGIAKEELMLRVKVLEMAKPLVEMLASSPEEAGRFTLGVLEQVPSSPHRPFLVEREREDDEDSMAHRTPLAPLLHPSCTPLAPLLHPSCTPPSPTGVLPCLTCVSPTSCLEECILLSQVAHIEAGTSASSSKMMHSAILELWIASLATLAPIDLAHPLAHVGQIAWKDEDCTPLALQLLDACIVCGEMPFLEAHGAAVAEAVMRGGERLTKGDHTSKKALICLGSIAAVLAPTPGASAGEADRSRMMLPMLPFVLHLATAGQVNSIVQHSAIDVVARVAIAIPEAFVAGLDGAQLDALLARWLEAPAKDVGSAQSGFLQLAALCRMMAAPRFAGSPRASAVLAWCCSTLRFVSVGNAMAPPRRHGSAVAQKKAAIERRWSEGLEPHDVLQQGLRSLAAHLGEAQVLQALGGIDPELGAQLAGGRGLRIALPPEGTPPLGPSAPKSVRSSPKAPGLSPVASRMHLLSQLPSDELTPL